MTDFLTPVDEAGVVAIEGAPGQPVLAGAGGVDQLLEACFGADCGAALLHAENLPPTFFDLSSGAAGAMLQKLRRYGVRLAVVRGPDARAVAGAPRLRGLRVASGGAGSARVVRTKTDAPPPSESLQRLAVIVHSRIPAGRSAAERGR